MLVVEIPVHAVRVVEDGVFEAVELRPLGHPLGILVEGEFRRVNPYDLKAVGMVALVPGAEVREGANAVDAGVLHEVHQHHLAAQLTPGQRRAVDPVAGRPDERRRRGVARKIRAGQRHGQHRHYSHPGEPPPQRPRSHLCLLSLLSMLTARAEGVWYESKTRGRLSCQQSKALPPYSEESAGGRDHAKFRKAAPGALDPGARRVGGVGLRLFHPTGRQEDVRGHASAPAGQGRRQGHRVAHRRLSGRSHQRNAHHSGERSGAQGSVHGVAGEGRDSHRPRQVALSHECQRARASATSWPTRRTAKRW